MRRRGAVQLPVQVRGQEVRVCGLEGPCTFNNGTGSVSFNVIVICAPLG
jgi:hypothetical protein